MIPSSLSPSPIDRAKRNLRSRQKEVREVAHSDRAGLLLATRYTTLLPASLLSSLCAGYFPIGSEIDARPVMASHHRQPCLLPVVEERDSPLLFRFWSEGDRLAEGIFGTRQPPPEALVGVPEVILVPLLAFDSQCMRLGYGGGFYDRTLLALRAQKRKVFALGLAFEAQRVGEDLPANDTDAPLDAVLTECRLYRRTSP